ncbi:acyl-CoA carboxylase subunit epsilon [Microbacterium sp. NIBRBAC000506063]|uniref:acyl-CoA carboxylase subunit epsilon n=1 Tax=Microbacterium sp. NIBRBAC000506063 TaxID=2734618 RepID=UPI001BB64511|nr:acyl-CoA carboxylase subunit epsilon [Microbacterium sp. NIBRBAC000506063]QTV79393.1 acyl-CoA carboxylase subunit epsilon [Microbacterium sp. NIBRBAC000506063]
MSESDDAVSTDLRILRGDATEEELAALIAVVGQAYAGEREEAVAEEPHVSAWARTQRGLRTPLRRDIPWGRFSG